MLTKSSFSILLLFTLFTANCFAQKDSSCSGGLKAAHADIAAGKIKVIINAFRETQNPEVDSYSFRRHTMGEYLQDNYDITYEYAGNSFNAAALCYNAYMDSVIDSRYGKDFDERCQKKVDSMNAIEQMNALNFYGTWDQTIDSLCSRQSQTQCDSLSGTIVIKLEINPNGYIKTITVSESFCPDFAKELTVVLKKIKWTPATGILGKKVESQGSLKMIFKKRKLDKFDAYFY
jgi:hypothetical protein